MRSTSPDRRVLVLAAPVLMVLAASGCAGDARLDSYRLNPTPKVMTLGQTDQEVLNSLTVTHDTNLRSLNEDVGRALLLDRPSRMVPRSIPY